MADILCLNCFQLNPEDAEICQFCSEPLNRENLSSSSDDIFGLSGQSTSQSDDELPDWLLSWGEETQSGGAAPAAASESVPAQDTSTDEEEAPEGDQTEEAPDWLARVRERNRLDQEDESETSDQLPGWLTGGEEPDSPVEESRTDDLTEDIQVTSQEAVFSSAEDVSQEFTDEPELPDWLKNVAGDTEAEDSAVVQNQPDWLSEFSKEEETAAEEISPQSFDTSQDQAATQLSEKEDSEQTIEKAEELPDWLANFQTSENISPTTSKESEPPVFTEDVSSVSDYEKVQPFSSDDLPDWLARMSSPEESLVADQSSLAGKEGEDEISLEPAELPSWVKAMQPIESATLETPTTEADEKIEKVGPLAGLRGVLQPEPAGQEVRKPLVYSVNLQVTEKQRINTALFETILSTEREPQAPPHERPISSQKVSRIIIAVVLILAAIIPVWQNPGLMSLPGTMPLEVSSVQNGINNLTSQSTVLLAVDYEPALSGEINAVATSMIAQLMSKSVKLVLISTNPTGPVLGEELLRQAQQNHPSYTLASQTINLGYLAGGPSGLLSFSLQPRLSAPLAINQTKAWSQPILQNIQSLSDFAGLIVITDNADAARNWVEQVQPSLGNTPLYMITSAQTSPIIQPYFDAGQINGYISGLTGGAVYEQSMQIDGTSTNFWDAYQVGIFVVIILIAVGGLIALGNLVLIRRKTKIEE